MGAPSIVAFGGPMGHGKDTLAGMIAEIATKEGIIFDWSKFATDLREVVTIITDIPAAQTISDADKAKELPERWYPIEDFLNRISRAIVFATGVTFDTRPMAARIAAVLTGQPVDTFEVLDQGTCVAIKPMTMGSFLQILGTDAFRAHVGEDVWVNSFQRRRIAGGCKPTLTPDDRFPNETASVKASAGVAVYVDRPGYKGRNDGRASDHASENTKTDFVAAFDFHVSNDGNLEDLREKALILWPRIKALALLRAAKISGKDWR